jgi:hypothetical protein
VFLAGVYVELASCRSIGMVAGPVPADKIWDWCDRHIPERPHEARRLRHIVMSVDGILARRQLAKNAAPKKPG